jgi:outer membrane protein OmpA-like peptidoglycan-associated protein
MINVHSHWGLLVLLALGVGLFAGCGGIPANHPDLLRARTAYDEVQYNDWVNENAPVEEYEASQALQKAEQAESIEDLEHLSYLAERRSQIAVAAAKTRRAEKEIDKLAKEKNMVLLEAREMEIQEKTRKIQAREREVEAARAEAALARKMANKLERELAELNAKETDRGIVLTLGDVLFEFDKAELMPGGFRAVNKLAAFLNEYENRNLLIEGHTDSIGTPEYNLDLSRRRAEAVRSALMEKEIARDRIITKGYGKGYPVASNATEAGRQQNRRVEVIILDEGVRGDSMLR